MTTPIGSAKRRSPYGANPCLGENGNRARSEILSAARELFGEFGYHGVTVDQIARRAGRSGAAVYQYFENKEEIFRIFVDELGAELIAHAKTIGDVTGPDGLDALRRFVGGLTALFQKHRVTAIEWPAAEAAGQQLLTPAESFLHRFDEEVRRGLGISRGATRHDPLRSVPMAMLSIVQWAEYTRAARSPELSQHRLNDFLARFFYGVITQGSQSDEAAVPGQTRIVGAPRLPGGNHELPIVGLRRPITPRSRPTVERILRAASQVFARRGYAGSNIQLIAEQAHMGKPSVYTYWTDREALFSTLAGIASVALQQVLSHDLASEVLNSGDWGRQWLDEWIDLVVQHGAVLHIWTHETMLDDTVLGALAEQMAAFVTDRLGALVPGPRPQGHDPVPILLWALLVEFPYTMSVQLPELERDELRELLRRMIHWGLPAICDTDSEVRD
ncbi:TetR/AcrR family transcriptional regulator [Mycobacterium heckeshornense]|uniref:TetR/AcrR family transcriptional regulator n=1 Tax=Mycobacterium heckeshornense TaxID=110505 RepID=UPI0019432B9A|nr:TetR/AcrR family transcriptional regulator [Mycobacterium heckeshornense]